jgi:hypothetical protein
VRLEEPVPEQSREAASLPEAALLRAQSVIDGGPALGAGRATAEARILSEEKLSAFAAARLAPKDSLRRLGERWLDELLASRGLSPMTVASYRQDLAALADFTEESLGEGLAARTALSRLDDEQLLFFIVWLRQRGDGKRTLARRLSMHILVATTSDLQRVRDGVCADACAICCSKAIRSSSGSFLPRSSALRKIPSQAFALK